jgi:hypothetical protein
MREDIRKHIAEEANYARAKMQEVQEPRRKLFYFSVFFGEAQRLLNLEWSTEMVLIYTITQFVYTQLNTAHLNLAEQTISLDWTAVYNRLIKTSSELAGYLGKKDRDPAELYQIMGRFAELSYAASGNGSYLLERGAFKL